MKKNIIAMAVAAAVAAPAAAMADTTLYGKIHASYDFWGGDTASGSDYSLSSNQSRIGIKGTEEISDNLSLIYQWENGLDWGGKDGGLDTNARNTFIGFTGGWGTAIAGKHDTPFKMVGRKYELFNDTVADARAITRLNQVSIDDWDRRTTNTVAYMTPNLAGFSATLAYVSDWDNSLDNDNDAYSLSAGYEIAGFTIDAAYERHNIRDFGIPGMTSDSDAWRVGAGYSFGGFKVVGLYQNNKDVGFVSGLDTDIWGVGGAYSFGNSTVKAQYYYQDDFDGTSDTDVDMWAVGYDYKLSKQTSVYAVYASMDASANSPSILARGTAHGEAAGYKYATGNDSNAFSLGLIHKF
ncbi:MAG TPA: porin [Guyparkeria sp.]|nr:porin [Guyparkeria sp.]